MSKKLMKVYYGDGKGKTTSAIGQGILAASEGKSVIIIQFLKSKNQDEISFIRRLEPEIRLFRFEKSDACFEDLTQEQQAEESMNLKNGMNYARKVLTTGECDVLILDEVLGLLENEIISVDDLRQLKALADDNDTELIYTGIHASGELIDLADEVYCIEPVKG